MCLCCRARGVGPDCKSCRRGFFKDIYSKNWVSDGINSHGGTQASASEDLCSWQRFTSLITASHTYVIHVLFLFNGQTLKAHYSHEQRLALTACTNACMETGKLAPQHDGSWMHVRSRCPQVPVADDRFLAVNTFRLIGYLLNSAGSPCPALWDPDAPLAWLYGRHDKTMCLS